MAPAVAIDASAQQSRSRVSLAPAASAASPATTAMNKRDRAAQTKTAFEQPHDSAGIKLPVHGTRLIPAGGVVTLCGLIKNTDKKSRIESIAKRVAAGTSSERQIIGEVLSRPGDAIGRLFCSRHTSLAALKWIGAFPPSRYDTACRSSAPPVPCTAKALPRSAKCRCVNRRNKASALDSRAGSFDQPQVPRRR